MTWGSPCSPPIFLTHRYAATSRILPFVSWTPGVARGELFSEVFFKSILLEYAPGFERGPDAARAPATGSGAREPGTTVIVVTHDARVAAYADREIVVSDGKVSTLTGAAG